MNKRLIAGLATALALSAGTGARLTAQTPWTEPDLDAALKKLLRDPPPQWQLMGEWSGTPNGIRILPGSKVLCISSDRVIVRGKNDWKGTYDEDAGEVKVRRTLSAAEVVQMEDAQKVPAWARSLAAKQAIHEDMVLTVKSQGDGSLSMSGKIYGEKLDWEDEVDPKTGQSDPATQKARIVAGEARDLPGTYTKAGLSKESRDKLKQELHLMLLFQHRDDLLNGDVQNRIAALEKTRASLASSNGADERRRVDDIDRTIDNLQSSWQRDLAHTEHEIFESALSHSSYYNPEVQDILAKYRQERDMLAADPGSSLKLKLLNDTETRLLLYLGKGADAMYAHDDYEKRAFMYGMIRIQSDFAHGTAVAATGRAVSGACPEPTRIRFARAGPKSAIDAGVKWGKGIQGQGMPWEEYIAKQKSAASRLPPNFKTFDFFDNETGVATSAKTLDTTTPAKLADPTTVYQSLKGNIDAAVDFKHYELSGKVLDASQITARELQVAVPEQTTAAQWAQINRAIDYGNSVGVRVVVTPVK